MTEKINEKKYFFPYQTDWLKDKSQIKIWPKSRRIGATYVQAYEDVRDAAAGAVPSVWFSSADESAGKEYILYVEQWAKLLNIAANSLGEIVIDSEKDIKALSVELANGVRINALTSNPKRFRSKGGKVILDEFAHHKDQKEMWKAARPCITWGYPLRILSTHNGKSCLFFKFTEWIKKGKLKKWSLHATSIYDAVEQGLAKKILKRTLGRNPTKEEEQEWLQNERDNCADEETWQQEYCCNPQDEEGSLLTYEIIQRCEKNDILYIPLTSIVKNVEFTEAEIREKKIPPERTIGKIFYDKQIRELLEPLKKITGELYLGFDIARRKHLSCIWGSEKIGLIRFTRFCIVLEKVGFTVQEAIFFKILEYKATVRSCVDQVGIGENITENAVKKFGPFKVEGIGAGNPLRATIATNLYLSLSDMTHFIPEDEVIREDFHSVKKTTTPAGHIRYAADENEELGHADRFWGCAFANYASQNEIKDTSVKSAGKRKVSKITRGFMDIITARLARIYGGM